MAEKIRAELKNIQDLFSNSQNSILGKGGKFIIPDYQRAYSWLFNEQCDKLWQDIEFFSENKKSDGDETYFLGSIIINNDREELYVIDGQQRLTTFMILLKSLLIRINTLLEKMSNDEDSKSIKIGLENRRKAIIHSLFLIDEDEVPLVIDGSKKLSELDIKYSNKSINEEHQGELLKILRGESFDEIENNVAKIKYKKGDNKYTKFFRNFAFFKEKIEKLDSTKVNNLSKVLLNNCQVITIVSYQTEEAIEIFNSLNSTGLPLADADIISAKLYSNCKGDESGFIEKWSDIIARTNILDAQKISTIDEILNQYMYIVRAKNNEKETTLPSVRRYFTSVNEKILSEPNNFIANIEKIIAIWENNNISEEIITLRSILFKHNRNFKFFYTTYFFFKEDETDINKLKFVRALLKLFALLSIEERGYSSASFKTFLIGLNMDIGKGILTDELVEKIKGHICEKFDEGKIRERLKTSLPQNETIYLNEYLFAQETDVKLNLDIPNIEVEHIMPNSGKHKPAIMKDVDVDEKEFFEYINKLGNKILLEKNINARISDGWFRVKKQESIQDRCGYKDSIFPIAQSLVSYKTDYWKKEDIETATDKAAERILKFIFSKEAQRL